MTFTPDVIYLEPAHCADPITGSLWCEDNIGSDDPETGEPIPWTMYVRAGADVQAHLDAERARAERARAEAAEAFIRNLVDMQSSGKWTRAVVREAAADFLRGAGRSVSGGRDTSPAFVLAAEQRARAEAAEAKLATAREALRQAYDDAPGWVDLARTILRDGGVVRPQKRRALQPHRHCRGSEARGAVADAENRSSGMSEKINDGGPAFPRAPFDVNDYCGDGSPGMTLRDWFAGQALAGMGTWCPADEQGRYPLGPADVHDSKAVWAYGAADAMLKARSV